ncbi:bifunctional [glutamate--ammonia ligase]-adenylyl-L-tyrosine phosphorylase/[glutamate--ammonia-ligase] adenylyltransferase [Methylolobus aquaticus]
MTDSISGPAAAPILPDFATIPASIQARATENWSAFLKQYGGLDSVPQAITDSVVLVWSASPFVMQWCLREPEWLAAADTAQRLLRPTCLAAYRELLRSALSSCSNEADLGPVLRRFRMREMVRLAWRDIAGLADIDATLRETSELAEAIVSEALAVLFDRACKATGTPLNPEGDVQPLCVVGMGKLGAWELNFSSDIDLIFLFRSEGAFPDRRATSYSEFYTRLGRRLIQLLDETTDAGFVFRVDMRLRPFGDSGPLVMSFDALELYFQTQAREWERYAMVKARVIAGDSVSTRQLEALIESFVYRRYLDYRAFGELRDLKQKILTEVLRRDRQENIKLGLGGIREIEFVAQVFQLIRGGHERGLRDRRVIQTLAALARQGHLPEAVVRKLTESYRFLRTIENRLQEYQDQQTHDLPQGPDRQALLAWSLGYVDWPALKARVDDLRRQTHEVFEQVMAAPHTEGEEQVYCVGGELPSTAWLEAIGFPDPERAWRLLEDFEHARPVKRLTSRGAADLNRVMPLILRAVATSLDPELALGRLLRLLESIASRSVYFALLAENPLALSQLVRFAVASPWIIQHITQFPVLLDELLDPRALYRPLSRSELAAELQEKLSLVDLGDAEQRMVAFREFKQANILRVAATDIMGVTPLMVVSDYLSYLAETLVEGVLREAWRMTAGRHGGPPGSAGPEDLRGFGVVAYGKLGGLELGYGSDLDLVFLHNAPDVTTLTEGSSPVTLAEFYARVAKRLVSLMTTQTHAGALYEIDLRLRPSGNSGLLVSSLEAYETYQRESAWTWEQQSLVRARFIAGDAAVGERFSDIRRDTLACPRDKTTLRAEVVEMREKMRQHLLVVDSQVFDLKQGVGGIADIEFIVQFGVLANAAAAPAITRWTDVVRLLDALRDVNFLSPEDAETLRNVYCHYRAQGHRCALREEPALVPRCENAAERAAIQRIWQRIMQD